MKSEFQVLHFLLSLTTSRGCTFAREKARNMIGSSGSSPPLSLGYKRDLSLQDVIAYLVDYTLISAGMDKYKDT